MQAPSKALTQSSSAAVAPAQSAILAPPNLAPDDTDWISNASLTFKVLASAGEVDPTGIAKAIANIALPILELAQDNKKACEELKDTIKYLDEMLRSVSEETKLLKDAQSLMDASTGPLARLQQMGDEFVSHLEVLKDDLNKIYGKTGFRATMKRQFQSKAILDRINQHKVYVKEARDKFVATAVFSVIRQVKEVDAKVTVIHDHLTSPSKIQPVKYVSIYSLKYNSSHDSPLISSIMLSAIPPPSPSVFMGRDDLVQEGIANLLTDSPHSIIVMGFGGMGKTSLALRILNDEAVQAKYEAHRYFIPCDIVCSVDPTVEVLLQTMMKQMNLNLTGDAVKQLHTISKPTILVFDNFETLWDQSSDQCSIQMLLAQLNSVIQITLIITMRGSVAPIEDINWLRLPYNGLSSLHEPISLDIFSAISKCNIDEEAVKELVKELAGWPLAITLMAYQAKILPPKALLESWHQEKTLLLKMPGAQAHRLSSVDISIKITLQSLLLSSEPNVLKLLSVICYLPNGIPTWTSLINKILSDLSERISIISRLLQSGIIYQDCRENLKLLPPIQEYLKTYFQQSDIYIKSQFCNFYLNKIEELTSAENIEFGVLHSKNIEWLLNNHLDNYMIEKDICKIYNFCYFQYMTSESDILLKKVISVAKELNIGYLYASALLLLGCRLIIYAQYQEAQNNIEKAMEIFGTVGDTLGTAQCLRSLGDILLMTNQYSKATIKLKEAIHIFERIGDTLGAAYCLRSLGDILRITNQYLEATVQLEKAKQMFESIGDILGAAHCLQNLGDISQMTNQYSEATIKLEKAKQLFETVGDSLGAAHCLRSLGDILQMTGQYLKAIIKLEEAMQMFDTIGNTLGVAQCLQSLGNTLRMSNQYIEATIKLEKAMQMFETIGDLLRVAQCLRSLGDILQMTDQYLEATSRLEKAMQMFETIGNTLGVAQCLQSLGNILRMTNQYSEAIIKLEKAMQMFETIGDSSGAAQCFQRLRNISQITY
ncbi:hypothetical protein EV421DRAFT_962888 [Armillaria borealis]|uniref:Novel STAND NTPase 1 domain-containing protein n=1 Tax=Armillaria borealis TaxID=47425 RepID=A0AA39JAV8_9AGAR|nr:hypothetical protein EV421DRAFT_962888 [Armillaria borealis]